MKKMKKQDMEWEKYCKIHLIRLVTKIFKQFFKFKGMVKNKNRHLTKEDMDGKSAYEMIVCHQRIKNSPMQCHYTLLRMTKIIITTHTTYPKPDNAKCWR